MSTEVNLRLLGVEEFKGGFILNYENIAYKDEKMALLMTCAEMGWFFSEATYIKMKEKDSQDIRLGDYVKRLNLSQNKDLTFVDYVISSINNVFLLSSYKFLKALE